MIAAGTLGYASAVGSRALVDVELCRKKRRVPRHGGSVGYSREGKKKKKKKSGAGVGGQNADN